jgi:6-phosphogluconate dehydrogenase (decarboxylating)
MRAAIIGLGKMGSNMARRLMKDGHEIIGFNRTPQVTNEMAEEDGLIPAFSAICYPTLDALQFRIFFKCTSSEIKQPGTDYTSVALITPLLETLAPTKELGWGHVGPNGSGHFVKMIHNGIEYGMMQAYAEGFEILKAKDAFNLDLHQISEIWRYGSVIRSWLLDLTARALEENPELEGIKGWVADSGEGRAVKKD